MRIRDALQRIVRSRPARLALALGLVALGLWAFLPHAGYRIASSAFVNAELVRVAAPIPGQLTRKLPVRGAYIDNPAAVLLIELVSKDNRHLLELIRQQTVAKQRAALASQQLEEIARADEELSARTQTYREGVIARLGHERGEAKAELKGCLAEVLQRRDVGSRLEELAKSGVTSKIRSSEAHALAEAASTRCAMASERLQRLQAELASAQNGVFLRDGINDAPYSQQQRDRLMLRRQELETKRLEETLQASQIAAEIDEERQRIDRLSHFDITLPADHVIWSVAASPGSMVSQGQTVLDLASCSRRFVVVELPEREFERITVGAPASVRLLGSSRWTEGHVRQVRGSAARADDRLIAAQVPRPLPNSITVEVALPDSLQADVSNFCNIGRLAEVRFPRSNLALFDSISRGVQEFADRIMGRSTSDRVASN